jgi:hypothetical protein
MAAKGYTSEENIESYGLVDIAGSFSNQIDGWIEGVEGIIDDITGRNFIADEEASPRLFDGPGSKKLIIDDAVEITKLEIGLDDYGGNFQEILASGVNRYFTLPANGMDNAGKPVPFTALQLRAHFFQSGMQNQRVTAKWGYSVDVPKEIEFAATVFAFGIVNQQRQSGQSVKSEKIGNYAVTYNSDNGKDSWGDFERALAILDKYKRYYF